MLQWIQIILLLIQLQPLLTGCGTAAERTKSITERIKTASSNQIFLLPYNPGAIANFKSDRNKKGGRRKVEWKPLGGIPEQDDSESCGYYVMRYTRDIVFDTEMSFAVKWASRTGRPKPYEQVKIDEVREEIAGYVLKKIVN